MSAQYGRKHCAGAISHKKKGGEKMTVLRELFTAILNMSVTAGIVILVILAVRGLFRNISRKYLYLLWAIVAVRLICPWSLESGASLFNIGIFENVSDRAGTMMWYEPEQKDAGSDRTVSSTFTEGRNESVSDHGLQSRPMTDGSDSAANNSSAVNSSAADLSAADLSTAGTGKSHIDTVTSETKNPTTASEQLFDILAVIWIAGVFIAAAYQIYSWIRLKRIVRYAIRLEPGVYECDVVSSPFIMGVIWPQIYLPLHLSDEQRTMALLHERCHIGRHDHQAKVLAVILRCIYWFHPLVWAAFHYMSADMEMSCDEMVLERMGSAMKEDYGECLLAFAVKGSGMTGITAFGESSVKKRIRNVLNYHKRGVFSGIGAAVLCIVLCVVLLTNTAVRSPGLWVGGTQAYGSSAHVNDWLLQGIGYRLDRRTVSAAFYCEFWLDGELAGYRLLDVSEIGTEAGKFPDQGQLILKREYDFSDEEQWKIYTQLLLADDTGQEGQIPLSGNVTLTGSGVGAFGENFCVDDNTITRELSSDDDVVLAAYHIGREYGSDSAGVNYTSCEELDDRADGNYWTNDPEEGNGGELLYRMAVSDKSAEEMQDEYRVSPWVRRMQQAAVPYIGDAAAVMEVLQTVFVQEMGAFDIELETGEEPYILTIHFSEEPVDSEVWNQKMRQKAVLLLSLIGNADIVRWTYPDSGYGEMSLAQAEALTGVSDIKGCTDSPENLQSLWEGTIAFTNNAVFNLGI